MVVVVLSEPAVTAADGMYILHFRAEMEGENLRCVVCGRKKERRVCFSGCVWECTMFWEKCQFVEEGMGNSVMEKKRKKESLGLTNIPADHCTARLVSLSSIFLIFFRVIDRNDLGHRWATTHHAKILICPSYNKNLNTNLHSNIYINIIKNWECSHINLII